MSNSKLGYLDAKREEFRRYLEQSGVMDAFTKVLVGLYEEPQRPKDALEYVKKHLGDDSPELVEFESMKAELEEYKARLKSLESENEELKKRLGENESDQAVDDSNATRTPSFVEPKADEETTKEEPVNE
ncbi:c-Myc-binding protein-like [Ischnura elegans]|uniref:c-Myc-binding protein-like n=1 Tax=Ischnura elegans TaxID=197161 RepID=UPI001ED8B5BF|nr:c-Myc-binding protein-like [Ischnura elegans]